MMSGLPPPGGGNKTVQMVDTNSIVKTEANLPLQTPTSQVIQPNGAIHPTDSNTQYTSTNPQQQTMRTTIPGPTGDQFQQRIMPGQTVQVRQTIATVDRPIRPVASIVPPSIKTESGFIKQEPKFQVAGSVPTTTGPGSGSTTSGQPTVGPGLQSNSTTESSNPNGLTPEELTNVQKCKNFLITLIQLAQRNEQTNPRTVQNVKDLVQQLIDDRITPTDFTERLQTELQSTPQPYLVPFLTKSLPLLRRSMQNGGSKARPAPSGGPPPMPVKRPAPGPNPPTTPSNKVIKHEPGPSPNTTRVQIPMRPSHPGPRPPPNVPRITLHNQPVPHNQPFRPGQPIRTRPRHIVQTHRPKMPQSVPRDDDRDETDVTYMADVDIHKETKLMTDTGGIGTEIKHAPGGDEPISVNKQALHKLVGQAASRAGGIERVTPDGARLIGLALEEYVKNLVSKAIHAASHRNIQFKDNEHREKVNDVKTQFKLLQEIMLNEKQKAEEAEQEQRAKLLRSRNKKEEDPEREKKKKDAKMKQQAIQEREQLKQADETALIASQRKRPTTSVASSSLSGGSSSRVTRVTRVKMRDLLFCLESERLDKSSRDEVYKRYLK